MSDLTEENFAFLCRVIQSHKSALDEARRSLAELLYYSTDDGIPEEFWTDEWRAVVARARLILSNEDSTEPTEPNPCNSVQ